jgi:hypothetical protein
MKIERIYTENDIITKYENFLQLPNVLKSMFEQSRITALLLWLQTNEINPDPELIDIQLHNALLKNNAPIHSQSFSNSFQRWVCRNVKEHLIKFFQSNQ